MERKVRQGNPHDHALMSHGHRSGPSVRPGVILVKVHVTQEEAKRKVRFVLLACAGLSLRAERGGQRNLRIGHFAQRQGPCLVEYSRRKGCIGERNRATSSQSEAALQAAKTRARSGEEYADQGTKVRDEAYERP